MLAFKCPKCRKVMKSDEAKAGSVATCPGCGVKFRIPRAKADPASPTPGADASGSPGRAGRSTAITPKPPLDPRVRPAARRSEQPKPPGADAGGPAHSGSPVAEEAEDELEYSLDDVQEQPAPPQPRGEPPRGGQDDGVGGQVGREHPRDLVEPGGQRALDVGQRDVGDAGVEDLEHRHEHHGGGDGGLGG